MSLEQQIVDLTTATTNLLDAVNVRKSVLDDAVQRVNDAASRLYAGTYDIAPETRPDGSQILDGDRYINSLDGYEYIRVNGSWSNSSSAIQAAQIQADRASSFSAQAEEQAVRAEVARDAAQLSAGVYTTTEAGLAATTSGQYFSVPASDSSEYLILYQNSDGAAIEVKRYPSTQLTEQLVPLAPAGYAWSVVDKSGLAAFGIDDDGTVKAGRLEANEFQSDVVETNQIDIGSDVTRNEAPVDWAWIVTDKDGKSPGGFKSDGTWAVANTDTKELIVETINNAPASWIPSQKALGYYSSDIAHIISYGQSLSLGNGALGIQTLTQKYDSLMFNAGVRAQEGTLGVAGNRSSFVPLVETVTASKGNGETPVGNAAATIKRLIEAENTMDYTEQSYQLLGSAPGVSNNSIAMLSKPSAGYTNLINDVTYGLANSAALGKSYAVPTVFWSQGERDYDPAIATSYADYLARFLQLYSDLNTDIKAITGQPDDIKIIGYQACYTAPMPVALAQLQATKENENILIAAPIYAMEKTAPGNVHLSARGSALLGAYYGLVHKRAVIDRKPWAPVQPVGVWRQGAIIMVRFNVPTRPLVLDTTLLSAAPNYGFSLVDNSGADMTISSVSVAGPDTVRIVASTSIPAGAKIRYAFVLNADGWNGGNLRDSQGDYITDGIELNPKPLHNWCLAFEETIS